MVRTKAKETAQKAQFATIDMALDAFKQDFGDYPQSNLNQPPTPPNYCGAQELAEALVGWDLMGFHPKTAWRADGYSDASNGNASYDPGKTRLDASGVPITYSERKGPYLEVATANAFKLGDLFNFSAYSPANPLAPNTFVLCDVFRVRKLTNSTGKPVIAGAPILYYKANTSSKTIDPSIILPPNLNNRIYDYRHNDPLIRLQKLTANGNPGLMHPLGYSVGNDYPVFYSTKYPDSPPYIPTPPYGGSGIGYGIRDPKVTTNVWPYRPDSYILISAGPDGLYGTADDIHNY